MRFITYNIEGTFISSDLYDVKDILDYKDNDEEPHKRVPVPNYEEIFGTDYETGLILASEMVKDLFQMIKEDLLEFGKTFTFPLEQWMKVTEYKFRVKFTSLFVRTKDVPWTIENKGKENQLILWGPVIFYLNGVNKYFLFKPDLKIAQYLRDKCRKGIYYLSEKRKG